MSRKRTLVDHGFRLPSAMDNRPLKFEEFTDRIGQAVYLSATPGTYELGPGHAATWSSRSSGPTGLIDPEIIVKSTKGQIDDLVHEIRTRAERNERVLVTTLTKKMSEDLTDYLLELGIRVRYLHSEVDTLRRVELLRELRMGEFDVLVGINLLREGLDLPEVSLVSILDADKEGLPAQRHVADPDHRPRRPQRLGPGAHVRRHASPRPWPRRSTRPTAAARSRSPTTPSTASTRSRCASGSPTSPTCSPASPRTPRSCSNTPVGGSGRSQSRGKSPVPGKNGRGVSAGVVGVGAHADGKLDVAEMPRAALADLIQSLNEQMMALGPRAAVRGRRPAARRDLELKKELRGMDAAGVG